MGSEVYIDPLVHTLLTYSVETFDVLACLLATYICPRAKQLERSPPLCCRQRGRRVGCGPLLSIEQTTMRVILSAQHLHDKRKANSRWKLSADTDVTIQPVCRDALRDCLTGGCCARGQRDRKNKVQSVNLDPRACAAAAGAGMPCASARARDTNANYSPRPKVVGPLALLLPRFHVSARRRSCDALPPPSEPLPSHPRQSCTTPTRRQTNHGPIWLATCY